MDRGYRSWILNRDGPQCKNPGVTALPLGGVGEEGLTSNPLAMRIEAIPFSFDAHLLKRFPLVADPDTSDVQHGLRPGQRPVHTGPLHAIFDEVAASAFDDAAGDRVAGTEVRVIAHPLPVLVQVAAQAP